MRAAEEMRRLQAGATPCEQWPSRQRGEAASSSDARDCALGKSLAVLLDVILRDAE